MAVLCTGVVSGGLGGCMSLGCPALLGSPTTHYYTAVVSTTNTGSSSIVQFAWLQDSDTGPKIVGTVAEASSGVEYAFPRCDAMYCR